MSASPSADSLPTTTPVSYQPATAREWWGLAVLMLPTLLLALDMTVLHLAAPHLSADLKPTSVQLLWILDIYGFLIAGFLITMGSLGDRIGRRRLLLVGALAFALASILAAMATTANQLIAARALLGIAGATLMPSTLSLIRNMFHLDHERTLAITLWMTSFIIGSAIGPLVGGLMLEFFWWGSVFLLALPVMLLLLLVGPWLLPEFRDPQAGRLDIPSALLCVSTFLLLIYGLKDMAREGPAVLNILPFLAGLAVGALFVRRQRHLADPMFDLSLFQRRAFSVSVGAILLTILALSGAWLLIFQYLQGVAGLSALQAGIFMLPAAMVQTCAALLVPRMARWLPPATFVSSGMLLAVVGFICVAMVGEGDRLYLLLVGSVILGVGVMPMLILGTDLVVSAAPPEKAGSAAATSETAAELGMALGIALIGSLGAAVYRQHMLVSLPAELTEAQRTIASDTIGGALGLIAELPAQLAVPVTTSMQQAFTAAVHINAWVAAGIMLLTAALAAWLLRQVQLGASSH
ncbi:MAG: MFS transporter [Pseudomonadaceae bacterium]|nr:MAG: MFS transporter [Pseudomonadaceae bacterium]